ncbi:MAG: hypothetical protein AAFY76_00700 [Cyanobacteria bacterium J06649_11]
MLKKKALKILINLTVVSLPTFFIIFLLFEFFIFRYILPAAQTPKLEYNKRFLILKPSTSGPQKGNHSMGPWTKNPSKWEINNFGWINVSDYEKEKKRLRLAIIGDSYVMGLEVNTKDNFTELVKKRYEDNMDVYSFGMAGSPMSNYSHMAEYVNHHFDPDILLVNIVYNDFKESVYEYAAPYLRNRFWTYRVINDSLIHEIPPDTLSLKEGKFNKFLKSFAIGRYLYHNIKITHLRKYFKNNTSYTNPKRISLNDEEEQQKKVSASVEATLNRIKDEFVNKRVIITLDGLRNEIEHNLPFQNSPLNRDRMMLKEICKSKEIEFIDLTEHFQFDYNINKKSFGFEIDPHWNKYGHSKVAEIVIAYLNQEQN